MLRSRASIFFEAFSLLRDSARTITVLSLVIDVLGAVANAVMLAVAGKLLGLLASGTTWDEVVPWLVAAAIALAVNMVTSSLHTEMASLATEHVQSHAVSRVLEAATAVPFASFDSPTFYDRLRRAHESGSQHAWSIVQSTLSLTRGVFDLAAIVVVLAFVAPVLIAIAALAYIPMWIITLLNNRARYEFSWDETESDRRRSYIESLLGERQPAKEVRAFGLGHELLRQYRGLWDNRLKRLYLVVRAAAIRSAVAYLASSIVVTGALAVVVWLTIRGDLTIDQAGVGVIGVRQLSNGVNRTSQNIASLHRSAQFLGDYQEFRAEAASLAQASTGTAAPESISTIDVDNVSFAYPGSETPVLQNLSLSIQSGEVTAIVGANGSGKTTLLMLLAGLYAPTTGAIRWDGVDTTDVEPEERYRAIAPLFQDFVQFHFTVRENVSLTEAAANVENVHEALALAEAQSYTGALQHGIDTQLGKAFDQGTELSIGQWQRLALARALYRDAPLLLLDEPAAALDPGAEARLVTRLKSKFEDRCVVMISHRFASVRQADRILVLDEGQLIEEGSHDELMARQGAYRAFYQAQTDPLLGVDSDSISRTAQAGESLS